VRLIVNPAAGSGRAVRRLHDVRAALRELGLGAEVTLTEDLDDARRTARAAADAGELTVAFGGDGLIGAVAGELRGTAGVLGVLPGGRGNDFARALAIGSDPVAACQILATGRTVALDLGEVDGRPFVGIASCGIDAEANRIANRVRWLRGRPVYSYAALAALAVWRPATFAIALDGGRPRTVSGYAVAAANAMSYGGGMRIAPGARLDDGRLDVVIISEMPKTRFLRLAPTVFWGGHVRRSGVEVLRAERIEVSSSRPLTVYADGDPIAQLPATIRAVAGAVRVRIPA